jgi:type VI secretion system secreted protein Hcp
MADVDLFLKIEGIEGESQDPKHKGELQLLSVSKTVENSVARGAGATEGRGTSVWRDAVFTMHVDKAWPKLFMACFTGERLKKAVLTLRKAGKQQQEFLKITFSDVLVSRVEILGNKNGSAVPSVLFAFNYAHIEEEYKAQKPDGTLTGAIKYAHAVGKAAQ